MYTRDQIQAWSDERVRQELESNSPLQRARKRLVTEKLRQGRSPSVMDEVRKEFTATAEIVSLGGEETSETVASAAGRLMNLDRQRILEAFPESGERVVQDILSVAGSALTQHP